MIAATEKQISSLQFLHAWQGGFGRTPVNAAWKRLSFSMRERSGCVETLSKDEACRAIEAQEASWESNRDLHLS